MPEEQTPKEKKTPKEKVCLICIDGWGISPKEDPKGDAIRNAETPVMDEMEQNVPYKTISAHGLDVGLPDGLMGMYQLLFLFKISRYYGL